MKAGIEQNEELIRFYNTAKHRQLLSSYRFTHEPQDLGQTSPFPIPNVDQTTDDKYWDILDKHSGVTPTNSEKTIINEILTRHEINNPENSYRHYSTKRYRNNLKPFIKPKAAAECAVFGWCDDHFFYRPFDGISRSL